MLNDLEFKKIGEEFVSDPVQVTGDFGLNIVTAPVLGGSRIHLFQSMTGDKYSSFKAEYYVGGIYDLSVNGVIKGMYFKVSCSTQPISAKILIPDE